MDVPDLTDRVESSTAVYTILNHIEQYLILSYMVNVP